MNKTTKPYEVPLSIVLFFLIIYFISENSLFIKIGFTIGLLALLSKRLAYWINYYWKKIMAVIGFVNAHVLLSIIFFVVLFPISLFYRLLHRDSLQLKAGKKTYYKEKNHDFTKKDLENMW